MATDLSSADLSSPLSDYNLDTLPNYQINIANDGQPQAPWWSPIVGAAVDVGKGFAGAAIVDNYQRAGIQYQGPLPYVTAGGGRISAPGVAQAGTTTIAQQQLMLIGVFIIAAVLLFRGA